MHAATPYQLLADAVLLIHFGIVLFVVGGLVLVVAGNLRGWSWVNRFWLRLAHVAAIGVVVLQSWLGQACSLTSLESWLRVQAGSAPYSEGFIAHWVQRLLYHDAPYWAFTVAYTAFGLLVFAAWRYFPPRRGRRT